MKTHNEIVAYLLSKGFSKTLGTCKQCTALGRSNEIDHRVVRVMANGAISISKNAMTQGSAVPVTFDEMKEMLSI